MKRRQFIKTGLSAVAGLSFPTIIPSGLFAQKKERPTASNRITMAIIGNGGQGLSEISRFLGDSRVQVVAVCDVNDSSFKFGRAIAKKMVDDYYKNQDCKAYIDFREVTSRTDIDAVYIGTPDHWHAPIMLHALRSGKDVYGQKPLTHTLEEGRWVVDAVERYNRVFQTGSQQRSMLTFRRVIELVMSGKIGKLEKAVVGLPGGANERALMINPANKNGTPNAVPPGFDWDFYLGPAPYVPYSEIRTHWNWRWNYQYGGGPLMDWIGHHLDIAQWGMGVQHTGPVKFENIKSEFIDHPVFDTANKYSFDATYANGLKLFISSDKNEAKGGVTFHGTKGWIFADRQSTEASSPEILNAIVTPDECDFYRSSDHFKNFIDCVISRKEPVAPAKYAHRSASVGHIATIAMRLGRTQFEWNPDTEKFVNDDAANRMLGKSYRGNWFI